MRFEEGKRNWSVYDSKRIIAATSEALMAETNSAISKLEYGRATVLLDSSWCSSAPNKSSDESLTHQRDDDYISDKVCKAGHAALAAGNLDEALDYLNRLIRYLSQFPRIVMFCIFLAIPCLK
ncbi:Glycine dehydrogenase [Senna tora]|uniref:Glycine dehydrogenase n=1 Tax=Senna tora TaxID=362788 RepID=A0A834U0Y9_9FABA|nr:Glycine dehydrogenase [Senna tora]